MPDQPSYYVLTNATSELGQINASPFPDDEIWRQHGPIPAANGDAAIAELRKISAELREDKGAKFVAVAASRWKPRRMRRQLVERWALDDAELPDDEPAQGRLT